MSRGRGVAQALWLSWVGFPWVAGQHVEHHTVCERVGDVGDWKPRSVFAPMNREISQIDVRNGRPFQDDLSVRNCVTLFAHRSVRDRFPSMSGHSPNDGRNEKRDDGANKKPSQHWDDVQILLAVATTGTISWAAPPFSA